MREVAGIDGRLGDQLDATYGELTWGFRMVFQRLDRMADELRRDRSRAKLAQAVTLYHVIVEASLAQPGQHFIESYLNDRDLLPGFRAGMAKVALDEQRHIGFGVGLLSDLRKDDPVEVPAAVAEIIREVLPWTAAVLVPPGWDRRYTECFGFTLEDIGEEGASSFHSKLRSAGLAVDTLPGPQIFDSSLSPRDQAVRGQKLVMGGFLGEKVGPPSRDPELVELFFDTIRRGVDTESAPPGTTIQWEFPDFEPWHMRIDNGNTASVRGRVESPDLTLRIRTRTSSTSPPGAWTRAARWPRCGCGRAASRGTCCACPSCSRPSAALSAAPGLRPQRVIRTALDHLVDAQR
jgi:hypothetical protein